MRSPLETYTAKRLGEEGIKFEYEPYAIELFPSFSHLFDSYEKPSKTFKTIPKKIRAIHYTPDFVGDGWIIETKGMRTEEFNIKWKLLKYLFKDRQDITLYMPRRRKDVEDTIELIKNGQDKRVLRQPEVVKQFTKKVKEPKDIKTPKRKPRNRRLRQSTL